MPQNIQKKIAGRKGNTLNIARVAYFQAFISRTHVLALGGKLHLRGAQVHVGAAVAFRIKNEDAAQGLHELFLRSRLMGRMLSSVRRPRKTL